MDYGSRIKTINSFELGLFRYRVTGLALLDTICDCPYCDGHPPKEWPVDVFAWAPDEDGAAMRALVNAAKDQGFDDGEWEEQPTVYLSPVGPDVLLRLVGSPMLF